MDPRNEDEAEFPDGLIQEKQNVVVELHSVINYDLIQRRGTKRDNTQPLVNGAEKRKLSLDWTRHDLPNASAYVTFLRNFDWAATPLGPMQDWSTSLRLQFMSIVAHPQHRALIWGEQQTLVYNAGAVSLFGGYHPVRLYCLPPSHHIGLFFAARFRIGSGSICRLLRTCCSVHPPSKRRRKIKLSDELANQYGSIGHLT